MHTNKCKRCPAQIIWAVSASTGKRMPVDADPTPDGNVRLDSVQGETVFHVLSEDGAEGARRDGVALHKSHFATCPAAREFRRK